MPFYRIMPDNSGTFILGGTITFCMNNGIKTKLFAPRNPKNKREMIKSGAMRLCRSMDFHSNDCCWCSFKLDITL